MSYLSTSTSVATMSLVSRRWSNLWKHLQAFTFFHCFENREMFERFEFFVNSVLALRRSRDIRKFEIGIDCEFESENSVGIQEDCVEKWIFAAIGPQLEDLYIRIHCIQINLPPPFLMNCTKRFSHQCPLQGPALNYPEFRKLYHLKFILPCFNSNLLVDVLEKCHMLKVLIIQSNKEEPSPLRTWEPHSTKVPRCLKSHLTYIHIEGYQGCEDELTFVEYILRNGLVLETVLIFVDTSMDLTNKYCSVKRLLYIPRGSAKCQLKFDPVVSS